jgi:hypothetical protein
MVTGNAARVADKAYGIPDEVEALMVMLLGPVRARSTSADTPGNGGFATSRVGLARSVGRTYPAAQPSRPIERGLVGPGLLAHVLVSKFADHVPLRRHSAVHARERYKLGRSLHATLVRHAATLLQPHVETLRRHECRRRSCS